MRTPLLCLLLLLIIPIAPAPASAQVPNDADRRAQRRTPVVEVFEAAREAVVNISSTETIRVRSQFGIGSLFEEFFDLPRSPRTREITRTSVGSGFVIHPDGYIVTNAHVVAGTVDRKAIFSDGSAYDAEIIAIDTRRDAAILKVDASGSLPTIDLGRSDDLMIGETVIAIGNPLGYQHTVTAGVVSAIGRDLEFSRDMRLSGLIQTDASINPGNSGGPLLNIFGELIGINTAIRGDAQNIGFAIPVDQLREALPMLLDIEGRYGIRTGLSVATVDDDPRITTVDEDSPASRAGLRRGDVLVEVAGAPVEEGIDYHIALIGHRAGDEVRFVVDRDGRRVDVPVRLEVPPAPDVDDLALRRLGIAVVDLPDRVARRYRIQPTAGVLVIRVDREGPAGRLGLIEGDVLQAVGRRAVTTTEQLGRLLEKVSTGDELQIAVLRYDRGERYRLTGDLMAR